MGGISKFWFVGQTKIMKYLLFLNRFNAVNIFFEWAPTPYSSPLLSATSSTLYEGRLCLRGRFLHESQALANSC